MDYKRFAIFAFFQEMGKYFPSYYIFRSKFVIPIKKNRLMDCYMGIILYICS